MADLAERIVELVCDCVDGEHGHHMYYDHMLEDTFPIDSLIHTLSKCAVPEINRVFIQSLKEEPRAERLIRRLLEGLMKDGIMDVSEIECLNLHLEEPFPTFAESLRIGEHKLPELDLSEFIEELQ